jgi:signal transduction histidine kinase
MAIISSLLNHNPCMPRTIIAQTVLWKSLYQPLRAVLGWRPQAESAEYQAWRHRFLLGRLKIALAIAAPVSVILSANGLYSYFWPSPQFQQDILSFFGEPSLLGRLQTQMLVNTIVLFSILFTCCGLWWSRWGRTHPGVIFLLLCSGLTWSDMVVGTVMGIPAQPDARFFLVQAVIVPIGWRRHLLAHLMPIIHYLVLYPLFGLTKVGNRPFYNPQSIQVMIDLCWISLLCVISIYLYEQLKRSEFESQRQLRNVIYALSHDLKTPITGTAVALQGILLQPEATISIDRVLLEQVLAGSYRQIHLIDSLLSAQSAEIGAFPLKLQPLDLEALIQDVITDLRAMLTEQHMTIILQFPPQLPPIDGDKIQIQRVFNNLIANILKHNPKQTQITITATVRPGTDPSSTEIYFTVEDNGVGIPAAQLPHLFKLYSRGAKARRMPGLGLGLYLCQQIIHAHGGEIGVVSQPQKGSRFWFTLPISLTSSKTSQNVC